MNGLLCILCVILGFKIKLDSDKLKMYRNISAGILYRSPSELACFKDIISKFDDNTGKRWDDDYAKGTIENVSHMFDRPESDIRLQTEVMKEMYLMANDDTE